MRWLFLGSCFLGSGALALSGHPHLSDSLAAQIRLLYGQSPDSFRSESVETTYMRSVQRQTLTDAAEIYAPENQSRVKVAYASFTPDLDTAPGDDLGYGLHVVKRLEIPLGDGWVKVVEVNEAWPEHKPSGGILLPDELRVKVLVFDGARHVPGSHALYLYDLVRLTWGPAGEVAIGRRSRFHGSAPAVLRVPVAPPGSCLHCHAADRSELFAADFKERGELRDYEAIVHPAYYDRPVPSMKGYRDYLSYLGGASRPEAFLKRVRERLSDPKALTALPSLGEELRRTAAQGAFNWIGEDQGADVTSTSPLLRQGVYRSPSGFLMVDAMEGIFEGKYRWWGPRDLMGGEEGAYLGY